MKARHRIPPRAIKRFLQLAAASMAIGLGASPALAETDEVRAATYRGENQASAQAREEVSRLYLHSIALHEDVPQYAPQGKSVRLRILDASGRNVTQLTLDGEATVGPLSHGSYTVLLSRNGMTEVQRVRFGHDTLPYLRFTAEA
ncbi:MAG TPA: hypothetical protein PL024_11790 [Thauera sp.]|nr:hypothetical protein [Thauera sp.]